MATHMINLVAWLLINSFIQHRLHRTGTLSQKPSRRYTTQVSNGVGSHHVAPPSVASKKYVDYLYCNNASHTFKCTETQVVIVLHIPHDHACVHVSVISC